MARSVRAAAAGAIGALGARLAAPAAGELTALLEKETERLLGYPPNSTVPIPHAPADAVAAALAVCTLCRSGPVTAALQPAAKALYTMKRECGRYIARHMGHIQARGVE